MYTLIRNKLKYEKVKNILISKFAFILSTYSFIKPCNIVLFFLAMLASRMGWIAGAVALALLLQSSEANRKSTLHRVYYSTVQSTSIK